MRIIQAEAITPVVKELVIQANMHIPPAVALAIDNAQLQCPAEEKSRQVLQAIAENHRIAKESGLPLCQDTGITIVFVDLGEDVHIEGSLTEAITAGVAEGTAQGYLRASMVQDPLDRVNSGNNTPPIIHIRFSPGNQCVLHVMPKGGGSENKSTLTMINPTEGWQGVKNTVIETVHKAGSSACPPYIIGVGVGGSFEKAPLLAKEALLRDPGSAGASVRYRERELELVKELNALQIGPAGAGEGVTVLDVFINPHPCHIATLPVAVNICCHVHRHASRSL